MTFVHNMRDHIVADPGSSHYRSADSWHLNHLFVTYETYKQHLKSLQFTCNLISCRIISNSTDLGFGDCSNGIYLLKSKQLTVFTSHFPVSACFQYRLWAKRASQSGTCVFDEDMQVEATEEFHTEVKNLLQSRVWEDVSSPTLVTELH